MNYPLDLSFKFLTIGSKIKGVDANGNVALYVKQKSFKIKENITVFADLDMKQPLYHMRAENMIDFNGTYNLTNAEDEKIGIMKRYGLKSLFKAHYDIFDKEEVSLTVTEENPWAKVLDTLLGQIPIIGIFTGFFIHPSYIVCRASDNTLLLRLKKRPAFLESRFSVEKLAEFLPGEEDRALSGLLTLVILERRNG